MLEENKKQYDLYIESEMSHIWEIAKYIHENPELGYEEYKACDVQCKYLEETGFEVVKGVEELETAYVATYGSGYPVIGIVAEYDALKGLGHACGHNLICTSSILTAKALKKYLDESKASGTIKVIGTPAEEGGGGKIKLLKKHTFDGIDAVFMMHPTSWTTKLAGACLSGVGYKITFHGKTAQASSHPENGRNALSAANLYMMAIAQWRQHFKGDMRISQIITNGGDQPGIIPGEATIDASVRCFGAKDVEWLSEVVENCAKGSALAMDCTVDFEKNIGYIGRTPNTTLSELCRKEFDSLGEATLPGLTDDYGAEDLGNVSRVIPICNPYVTIFPDYKISGHTVQFRELAGSEPGYRCINVTAKALTRTIIEVLENTTVIDEAKRELADRLSKE